MITVISPFESVSISLCVVSKNKKNIERESQWRSVSASVSNARGSGFEPVRDKDFRVCMRRPKLLGAGDSHVLRMR
jgi:hypothetical protein